MANQGTRKVLVVDDSQLVLDWVRRVLTAAGYEVITRTAALGTSAAILREKPDLVLIDLQMPSLEGDHLIENIKSSELQPKTTVLLFSSTDQEDLAARAKKCGADGFLVKTSDETDLVRRVEQWIGSA